jgi:tetratricopeptide (TPR) repeat protein
MHPETADTLNVLALAHGASRAPAAAEPLFRRALAIRESALPPDHPELARSLGNLGHALLAAGRAKEATPLLRRAAAIAEAAFITPRPELAEALANLASLLLWEGEWAEGEALFRRALTIQATARGAEHPVVAGLRRTLAGLALRRGDAAGAEAELRQALSALQATLPSGNIALESAKLELGLLLLSDGRTAAAEPLLLGAHAALRAALGPRDPRLAESLLAMSRLAQARGNLAEAARLGDEALAALEPLEERLAPAAAARFLLGIAWSRHHAGRDGALDDVLRRARSLLKGMASRPARLEAELLLFDALLATQEGRFAEAEALLRRHFALIGPDLPAGRAGGLNSQGVLRLAEGRAEEAAGLFEEALAQATVAGDADRPQVAWILHNLALAYQAGGREREAAAAWLRALGILERWGWVGDEAPPSL